MLKRFFNKHCKAISTDNSSPVAQSINCLTLQKWQQTHEDINSLSVAQSINCLTLQKWQQTYKDINSLIVQASAFDGSDSWMPFPIGMSWQYGQEANKSRIQFGNHDKLALFAFSPTTDMQRRPTGVNRRSICNTLEKHGFSRVNLKSPDYFKQLPSYKFVFSPEGNGVDCHRHYEALLAGCIPIIEDNPRVREKYAGCPVLYTTDYSEITAEYLEAKYSVMLTTEYDFSRLFLWFYDSYQQSQIKICGNHWIKQLLNIDYYRKFTASTDYFSFVQGSPMVWITIINSGYVDYTKNFLKSMLVHKCPFTLVVYCLDKESIDSLSTCANAVCIDASEFLLCNFNKSLTRWGEATYKQIVFAKLDAMRHALDLCKIHKIDYTGYIDMDIIVFKDPTPIICEAMLNNPTASVIHQCDSHNQTCNNPEACREMCSGVIAFRTATTPSTIFHYTQNDIHRHMGDQDYLIKRIDNAGLIRRSISKYVYLNGVFPNVKTDNPLVLPATAVLLHFNFMFGSDKQRNMKRKNMWY